ncbi:MAG: fibronectin type III domain-containing protein [Clostridiales bacterium]|nr:fibronectin type III domain-containing protein [Clostridiales bacterium]
MKQSIRTVPADFTVFSKLTGGDKQVTLKWKSQKNITGYQIEYSVKKDFSVSKKVTVKKAKTLTTTIKKLKAGTKYYVRIRTYTTVKKKNYYSTWSKAKAVKTKAGKAGNESVEQEIETGIDVDDMSLEIDEISIDEIIPDDGEIILDEVVEVPVE